jgi:hypothetical protein
MSSAENAKVEIETSATFAALAAMIDSGDNTRFTLSGGTIFSGKSGQTPDIRPNGIITGRNLLSPGTTADFVKIAAFTAYSKGVSQTVSASNATISRPTSSGFYKINSITMASDGSVAVVSGTQATSAFSETRGANGGPPYIPEQSIEVGQIRTTGATSAVITTAEIFQSGGFTERYDEPNWSVNNIGKGAKAETSAETNAFVKFTSALSLIHTGGIPKGVYGSYYTPVFSEQSKAFDFVPAENSHTVSSQQVYKQTVGSVTSTLNAGSFSALLSDGVNDSIVANKDEVLTVRFFPDENKSSYILTQGKIGITRSFPADNQIQVDANIAAEIESAEFSG